MTYKVVAVIWEDHTRVDRQAMSSDPDKYICTTITMGALVKKTKKSYTIMTDIERLYDRDDCTFMIILRPTVQAIKEFGEIEIDNLRLSD